MPDPIPPVSISQQELDSAGFTASGRERYQKGVKDYAKILFEKSINYGEIDRASVREVTHDHVKSAAHSIANSFGKPTQSKWIIPMKFGQYICAAFVGLATNHMNNIYGAIGFVTAFCIGGILLYLENSKTK